MTFYKNVKEKKYKAIINIYTSIIFDFKNKEIKICNDAGRLVRPLLRVHDNKTFITPEIINKLKNNEIVWDDLISDFKNENCLIEYIDPLEQNFSMIALDNNSLNNNNDKFIYKYTHREIHPSSIFGILASCIPFPEHNQ